MVKSILINVQGLNIEDIPDEIADEEVWPQLDKNGGNVFTVEEHSNFGKWLKTQKFKFNARGWEWIVVWR